VLDCFSGSGSTMIAAHNTGRSFVGCEVDSDYYNKSLERLDTLSSL
jgi:site-specific DNA-methyltransferase (adenine-specific)